MFQNAVYVPMSGVDDSVTVILPCYNHERFLRDRIGSVLPQLRPYDEVVFLDDASTDGSVTLAKELLKDAVCPVRFLLNGENTGSPFAQWNKGLEAATKEWIWIAETDDRCESTFLSRLLEIAAREESQLVFSQSMIIDADGHRLASDLARMERHVPGLFERDFTMEGSEMIGRCLTMVNAIPNASAVLFRRGLLDRAGHANPSMSFTGDWDFWIRLLQWTRISFIADELNHFRSHAATTREKNCPPKCKAEELASRLSAIKSVLSFHGLSTHYGRHISLADLRRYGRLFAFGNPFKDWMFRFRWEDVIAIFDHYARIDGAPKIGMSLKAFIVYVLLSKRIRSSVLPFLQRLVKRA